VRYRRFEPLGRDLSVLVLGTALYRGAGPEESVELLDEWRRLGGNVLDTGREYGEAERVIGRWLAARGCRDEVVVLTKAGHHHDEEGEVRRRVTPEDLAHDLKASLEALALDRVDLLVLHRDDPSQPVGPIVEVLNEQRRAGRVAAFGASNWTTERLEQAMDYASRHGLEGFSLSSVNLSLAVWNEPPWDEVLSAHDAASLAWYGRTRLPLFSWSAQAAGFFSGRHTPDLDVVRVFDSEANGERRRRAAALGGRKGVSARDVALAWVLHQPFPTYAIIGPRTPAELLESVGALDVELTAEEVRWLDLEEDGWQSES
jgi:aryl-alcohol dehydrogenase-like predicted oxidoreductase